MNKAYLGDGLRVEDDGFQFTLEAEREEGTHYVCLDSQVLHAFFRFVEVSRGVKISVEYTKMNEETPLC